MQHVIQRFIGTMYPDAPPIAYLVLSMPNPHAGLGMLSQWFRMQHVEAAAAYAVRQARQHDMYFGVALRRPHCQPGRFRRGRAADVYVVPGLWADLDLCTGQHASAHLPTEPELRRFLATLPQEPTVIVHSGGGMHVYMLFREPFVIESDADRAEAALLERRFGHTLCTWAHKQYGWRFDNLSDLPRVLRLPATVNHKYGAVVRVLHEAGMRYNAMELNEWLLECDTDASPAAALPIDCGKLDIRAIAAHYGTLLVQRGEEWVGPHPVHGSSTGTNLHVNATKQAWRCWRCNSGGSALHLVAVCEGLIACNQAVAGLFKREKAILARAVALANAKFDAQLELDPRYGTVVRHVHGLRVRMVQPSSPWGISTINSREVHPWHAC